MFTFLFPYSMNAMLWATLSSVISLLCSMLLPMHNDGIFYRWVCRRCTGLCVPLCTRAIHAWYRPCILLGGTCITFVYNCFTLRHLLWKYYFVVRYCTRWSILLIMGWSRSVRMGIRSGVASTCGWISFIQFSTMHVGGMVNDDTGYIIIRWLGRVAVQYIVCLILHLWMRMLRCRGICLTTRCAYSPVNGLYRLWVCMGVLVRCFGCVNDGSVTLCCKFMGALGIVHVLVPSFRCVWIVVLLTGLRVLNLGSWCKPLNRYVYNVNRVLVMHLWIVKAAGLSLSL